MFLSNRLLGRAGLSHAMRQGARSCTAVQPPQRMLFSAEEGDAKAQSAVEEPTAAEIEANRQEWGIKYDDECLKFEKEWQAIAEVVEKDNLVYLESELSELQKKKVDMIADKVLSLNIFEQRYLAASVSKRVQRTTGMSLMKLNLDWPSLKQDGAGTWPPANPNWFRQQELMSKLGPFMGSMGGGMGGGGGGQDASAGGAEAAPAEEAAPKEKTHYDIELSKYDAAGKIKVIKEVRAIFGLGLKEAKELVEGAPVWLKKEVAKEEAEALAEKLQAVGAEIRLA